MCDYGSDKGYILGSQSLLSRTILPYYLPGVAGNLWCCRERYNHGHNIWRLFDCLRNFLLTTSETKRDC